MNLKTALLPAFLLAASAAQSQETAPIVIHVAGPVTGVAGSNGADMKAGAIAAAKKINEAGGVLGRQIEIRMEDDECSPSKAVSVANRIVGNGGKFVVGHYCSNATISASTIYNEYGILQMTVSQAPSITAKKFNMLFRITPNAEHLAKGYMDAVETEFNQGNNKIAIIGNHGDFAKSIADSLARQMETRKLAVTLKDTFPPEDTDYAAVITKLKSNKVGMVLIAGSEKEMGLIVRQSEDQNYKPKFILSSTAASAGFPAMAGCAAQGVNVVAAWNPLYTPDYLPLLKYLKENGVNGIDVGINIYAAVETIAQAMEKAKSVEAAAVARVLHAETVESVLGKIPFTPSGELRNPRINIYEYQSVDTPCTRVDMRPVTP